MDERLKRRVEFRQHNLLPDSYPGKQHLVLCRNVINYFESEAQRRVVERLAESLVPGGILFLGGTDLFFRPGEPGLKYVSPYFYRRAS
ncbi:MAG TPA: hypothetical protein GX513_01830 [Firmicutes bacterium]|nr:hypothetical protein [Bacillota bacterium]